jgi:hypothetical protein
VGCNYISSKLKRNKHINNQEDNRIQKNWAKDLASKSQHLIENFMASSEDNPKNYGFIVDNNMNINLDNVNDKHFTQQESLDEKLPMHI